MVLSTHINRKAPKELKTGW